MLLLNKRSENQKQLNKESSEVNNSSWELQILGELVDELFNFKEKRIDYCCKAKNLLHVFQGTLELQGIDISKKIEIIVEVLDSGIDETNWPTIDRQLLDMYRIVFLFC